MIATHLSGIRKPFRKLFSTCLPRLAFFADLRGRARRLSGPEMYMEKRKRWRSSSGGCSGPVGVAVPSIERLANIVELRVVRGGPALPLMRVVLGGWPPGMMCLGGARRRPAAIETLLPRAGAGDDLVMCVSVEDGCFAVRLEGLTNPGLKAALLASDPFQPCEGCLLDVRLFLDSLVDSYAVVEESSERFAVQMKKRAG